MWDFLALHRADLSCDHYEASLYMLGEAEGEVEFVAPTVSGDYTISAVRELKVVLQAMRRGPRRDEFQVMVDLNRDEHFRVLDTAGFTVLNPG